MVDFFISEAMAGDGGGGEFFQGAELFMIAAFALVFYFFIWRPQSKRTKEHRALVAGLAKGDEVVTNGGLIGRIIKIEEQYLLLEVAENVELKLQKGAIATALPKGTIKSI